MIRPAYWTDADLHTNLTADQREFYIGLWMLADDAGYDAWDPERVGAELYPYRSPGWRRNHLPKWIELLGAHVQVLDCSRHLLVPNLSKYNSPPKPSYPNRKAHEACMVSLVAPHGTTGDHGAPAQEGKGREGKGSEGGRARDVERTTEETEFQRRVPASIALGRRAQ
jgi:hypothetical protein